MQRRAQIGLNKGEAHQALKNALRIGRQGEIRDRTTEGQHYRIAGLNLLMAIIIYWNTVHLGHAVAERRNEGLDVPPELQAYISPLGWAHILLTANISGPPAQARLECHFAPAGTDPLLHLRCCNFLGAAKPWPWFQVDMAVLPCRPPQPQLCSFVRRIRASHETVGRRADITAEGRAEGAR